MGLGPSTVLLWFTWGSAVVHKTADRQLLDL